MTQNTEQNMRTREETAAQFLKDSGYRTDHQIGFSSVVALLLAYAETAEARGAEEQRRKDAEGQEPVAWHYYDEEDDDGRGGWRYSSSKLPSRYEDVHPLYDRPANVAALEAEIAPLKEAEQLARADAEASKARAKVLEKALVRIADSELFCGAQTLRHTARTTLTREGGV